MKHRALRRFGASALRRFGASAIAVSVAASLYAQSSGQNSVAIGDGIMMLTIDFAQPFAQANSGSVVRVGGTEANISVGVSATIHDPAVFSVLESKLWIGGEQVTLPAGFDGGTVRFAPTHFLPTLPGQPNPKVVWEVMGRLVCSAHGKDETKTLSVELPFNPWNRAIVYGTRLDANGFPNLLFAAASGQATDTAGSHLAAQGHVVNPATGRLDVAKASILGWLPDATFYFSMAHGDPGGVNDSFGVQQQAAEYLTFNGDVSGAVAARPGNGVPKFRYAVLYSCRTLTENSPEPYPKFNMQDLDGEPRDSVYCGFEKVVLPMLAPGNTDEWVDANALSALLSTHTADLFMHWAGGPTPGVTTERIIEKSVLFANLRNMPRGEPVPDPAFSSGFKCRAVPMLYRGDPRTTLRTVYLTPAEKNAAGLSNIAPNTWYFVWNN